MGRGPGLTLVVGVVFIALGCLLLLRPGWAVDVRIGLGSVLLGASLVLHAASGELGAKASPPVLGAVPLPDGRTQTGIVLRHARPQRLLVVASGATFALLYVLMATSDVMPLVFDAIALIGAPLFALGTAGTVLGPGGSATCTGFTPWGVVVWSGRRSISAPWPGVSSIEARQNYVDGRVTAKLLAGSVAVRTGVNPIVGRLRRRKGAGEIELGVDGAVGISPPELAALARRFLETSRSTWQDPSRPWPPLSQLARPLSLGFTVNGLVAGPG